MSFKDMAKDKTFLISTAIIVAIILFIVIYPAVFTKVDPSKWYSHPSGIPPFKDYRYPFGTTLTGQNVIDLVPVALRNSLIIGVVAAAVSVIVAIILSALVALAKRGTTALMVFIDTMCSIPPLPVLIVAIFAWRDYITIPSIGLILSIFGWARPSRTLVSILIGLRDRIFVYTSYLSGLPSYMIVLKDFMPYILRYLLVNFINLTLWAIGMEITISMFGAMKMEIPTIGTTLYFALQRHAVMLGLWWWYAIPAIFLIALVLPIYIVGVKIDEYLIS
jgi:peptide/nickel transport system permease protein